MMANTKPLLVLEVLTAGDLAHTWRQTTCQFGKTLFPQTTSWAVVSTDALSRTHMNFDPRRRFTWGRGTALEDHHLRLGKS